jgi:hypothetical protein
VKKTATKLWGITSFSQPAGRLEIDDAKIAHFWTKGNWWLGIRLTTRKDVLFEFQQ